MPKKTKKKRSELDKRLINLVFLNMFLIASGFLWLDYLGFINFRQDIFPALAKIPGFKFILPRRMEDPYLFAKEEYKKQELVRKFQREKLKEKENELNELKMKLSMRESSLKEMQNRLTEKEQEIDKKYQDKETYLSKIKKQAVYFVSMRPEDAVKRLSKMEDLLIIDILKAIDKQAGEEGKQSIVPYFLSLMDTSKASVIQRKMTTVEEDNKGTNF